MNLYKQSKLPAMVQKAINRKSKVMPFAPPEANYDKQKDFDILKVYEFQARQKLAKEQGATKWKGGDA